MPARAFTSPTIAGLSALAVLSLVATTPALGARAGAFQPAQSKTMPTVYQRVLVKEAQSKAACESQPNRVFAKHRLGSECIAYAVTRGHEQQPPAVVYLHGDIPAEQYGVAAQAEILEGRMLFLQRWADTVGIRIIALSRPGVLGSSGNHRDRRKPAESMSVNAAVDAIKSRLGIDEITLVGQSGGSTIAASLLTLGRSDIKCAVLGAGALPVTDFEMHWIKLMGKRITHEQVVRSFYDPAAHLKRMVKDDQRRIFVIGDPGDQRTPFPLQQRFADSVQKLGHHSIVIEIAGAGPEKHGAVHAAIPAAALCAAGAADEAISRRLQPRPATPKPAPIAGSSTRV